MTEHGPVTTTGLDVPLDMVRALERRAARAWPATFVRRHYGWRLRHSPGVGNRRVNSALPIEDIPPGRLDQAIDAVEAFYGERSLPARFMVSPAVKPEDLDRRLADRGYGIEAPTDVQWADAQAVIAEAGDEPTLSFCRSPSDEWMAIYMEGERDPRAIADKKRLIERIAGHRVSVSFSENGGALSVGLDVLDDGWTGVFCMHTLKQHRRRGYGRRVLGALARWSRQNGAEQMYLQVETDNPGARRFYERAGFRTRYGYQYRSKGTGV